MELAGFLFTYFGSPPKYGLSPSFLQVTECAAYDLIGIYGTCITILRVWESVGLLQRNSSITFLTWEGLMPLILLAISGLPPQMQYVLPCFWAILDGPSVDLAQGRWFG